MGSRKTKQGVYMKSMAQVLIIGLVALVATSCGVPIWGNGVIVDRTVGFNAAITELISSGTANVVVVPSKSTSVVITADENLQQYFSVKTTSDVLEIDEQPFVWLRPSRPVVITVYAPPLALIDTSGTGDMSIDGSADLFQLKASGTGDISFSGTVTRFDADISGTGDITLSGVADRFELDASGTGNTYADGFTVRLANILLSGTGNCTIRATQLISGAMSGIGDLSYSGGAVCMVVKTGLGSIRQY